MFWQPSRRTLQVVLALGVLSTFGSRLSAVERFELKESLDEARTFKVTMGLDVSGKLHAPPDPKKPLPLSVEAHFEFEERRLAGTGREAQSLRSLRNYDQASATIHAGDQESSQLLRNTLSLVVVAGKVDGMDLFAPAGPLTYGELELLRTPGDPLAILGLLPEGEVEIAETWQPADWVPALLTGVEAAEKSVLTCKLESADKSAARVTFEGEITGLILGAPAHVKLSGNFVYDFTQKGITQISLTQTEKRSIGAVAPGLDVTAKVSVTREVAAKPKRLTEKLVAEAPLEANDASRLLMFDAPAWNVRFYHDRVWHLFHQNTEVAILRMLDAGRPIAQCNIKKLPDTSPGEHVAEDDFRADVQKTLGKNFQEFVQSEKIKVRDELYVYRVIAVGAVERQNDKGEAVVSPMQWIYYLVANSDGRQLAFVFTVDPKLADDLKNRDLSIVGGLEFQKSRPTPIKATPVRRKEKLP